jgi:hypothetical protein
LTRLGFAQLPPLFGALALLVGAGSARAQNPAAAEALFDQARAAMAAGSYDIACARFRDSDRLDPAVGTRFNLADCEERRGRVATAWSLFRGVLSELAQDDDRRPIADERARRLEPRLPKLTLLRTAETPPGVQVWVDGVELGEGSFGVPLPMDPGAHELSVSASAGAAPERSSFSLKEKQHSQMPIRLVGAGAAGRPASAATAALDAPAEQYASRRRWAYVAGGAGVGGVAFGAVTGIVTLNKKSTADANCNDEYETCNSAGVDANESGKTFAALSGIGFGVGAVGLAVGAYLLLTTPSHPSIPAATETALAPTLSIQRSSGFVGVAGRF